MLNRIQAVHYLAPGRKSVPTQAFDRASGRVFEMAFPRFESEVDVKYFRAALIEVLGPRISKRQLEVALAALKSLERELFPPDVMEL